MAEQTITATPVNAPDILRNEPLSRQVDVEIESNILEPVSHSYQSASGGTTRFVLPKKGVMDAPNTTLAFELNSVDALAFPINVGGAACIERCTLYCGGQVMSRIVNSNLYNFVKNGFKDQAVKNGILDVRHQTSTELLMRTLPGRIATISSALVTGGQQALYNPELDQTDDFGRSYNGGQAVAHVMQISKGTAVTAGQGVEISLKLSDLFPILKDNKLPLLAMAQVEIEIQWAKAGNAAVAAANILDCSLIERNINAGASTCVATMVQPRLLVDYIHYDDMEKQKIFDSVNNPAGMALNFMEVVYTNGVNPGTTADAANGTPITSVASNHLLGMSMKEVLAIFVVKNWNLTSAEGMAELNNAQPVLDNAGALTAANLRIATSHRNPVTRQFKSQQILGEKYNWTVNNLKVYSKDVDNPAMAHNYLCQCEGGRYNVAQAQYDTGNYNLNQMKQLLSSQLLNGDTAAGYTDNNTVGDTSQFTLGSSNVIGLNLKKNNMMGVMPGNGTRIGSAPIEFNFSCLKHGDNAAAANRGRAEVNLDFFIEYRRSMIIKALGVAVSDN